MPVSPRNSTVELGGRHLAQLFQDATESRTPTDDASVAEWLRDFARHVQVRRCGQLTAEARCLHHFDAGAILQILLGHALAQSLELVLRLLQRLQAGLARQSLAEDSRDQPQLFDGRGRPFMLCRRRADGKDPAYSGGGAGQHYRNKCRRSKAMPRKRFARHRIRHVVGPREPDGLARLQLRSDEGTGRQREQLGSRRLRRLDPVMGGEGAHLALGLLPHDGPIELQHLRDLTQAVHKRLVNRVGLDGDQS